MKSKKYIHSRKKISKQKKHNTIKKRTRKYRKKGGVLFPGEKVKSFIMQRRPRMTSNFLKSICSDSGVCIAFGTESDKIKRFFNGFSSFDYCTPPVQQLSRGNNGFVSQIKYQREDYIAYTILKSSIKKEVLETRQYDSNSDNLAYEYIVGQFLNKVGKAYPCFLETYGIFRYINDEVYTTLEKEKSSTVDLKNSVQIMNPEDPSFLSHSCLYFNNLCILIQHITNAKTLHNMLNSLGYNAGLFINQELLFILYQVYMPLAFLANRFTHYDLHLGNVLLYKPIDNGFIEYHYHLPGTSTTSFKSQYLVKIIDYGRCFFNDTPENNSLLLYNALCENRDCDETEQAKIKRKAKSGSARNCGLNNGYNFLDEKTGRNYFISSQKRNESHDLRLLFNIREFFSYYLTNYRGTLKDNLVNFINNVKYDAKFGTKEMPSKYGSKTIYNVRDAFWNLNQLVKQQQNPERYLSLKKIGDLHIYADEKPAEFIPLTNPAASFQTTSSSSSSSPSPSPSPPPPPPFSSPPFPSPLHEPSPFSV